MLSNSVMKYLFLINSRMADACGSGFRAGVGGVGEGVWMGGGVTRATFSNSLNKNAYQHCVAPI